MEYKFKIAGADSDAFEKCDALFEIDRFLPYTCRAIKSPAVPEILDNEIAVGSV